MNGIISIECLGKAIRAKILGKISVFNGKNDIHTASNRGFRWAELRTS